MSYRFQTEAEPEGILSGFPTGTRLPVVMTAIFALPRLEAGVSSERVLSLKQQVESGTYRPDARRIAEKLLGYR